MKWDAMVDALILVGEVVMDAVNCNVRVLVKGIAKARASMDVQGHALVIVEEDVPQWLMLDWVATM